MKLNKSGCWCGGCLLQKYVCWFKGWLLWDAPSPRHLRMNAFFSVGDTPYLPLLLGQFSKKWFASIWRSTNLLQMGHKSCFTDESLDEQVASFLPEIYMTSTCINTDWILTFVCTKNTCMPSCSSNVYIWAVSSSRCTSGECHQEVALAMLSRSSGANVCGVFLFEERASSEASLN